MVSVATMKKTILQNGLKVIYYKTPGNIVTIQCTVFSGSNNEEKKQAGISHFLEHMLFEGTTMRPDAQIITNEIERLGGEFNATTENEYVSYYVTIQNKHLSTALNIMADIYKNALISKQKVEKERKVVIDEVKMINDNPRSYQMIMFEKVLFKKHPLKNPIYGTLSTLKSISRDELYRYYKKIYIPNNTLITVVGNVSDPCNEIKQQFRSLHKQKMPLHKRYLEPPQKRMQVKETKAIEQSYLTIGWKTVSAKHHDIYTLDVIAAILGRGGSGKLYNEIRNKRGLCYNVGIYHNYFSDMGYVAIYCGAQKKNIPIIKDLIIKELQKLQEVTEQDLKDAKTYLEGDLVVKCASTQYIADELTFWERLTTAEDFTAYIKKINKVTINDIKQAAKKYFTADYTLAMLEQKE